MPSLAQPRFAAGLLLAAFYLLPCAAAAGQSGGDYRVPLAIQNNGADRVSAAGYRLSASVGDPFFAGLIGSGNQILRSGFPDDAATQTSAITLGSSVNPSSSSQTIRLTATVTGNSPSGSVAFKNGGTAIAGCAAVALTAGTASCDVAGLAAGNHSLTASYGGDTGNAGADSAVLTQEVLATYAIAATASPAEGGAVSCSPNPVTHGGSSTCTATPNAGYVFGAFSGDCSGSTCILVNVAAARSITAGFAVATAHRAAIPTRAAGVTANLDVIGCGSIDRAVFVAARPAQSGRLSFPYGVLDFGLGNCGSSATVTVTYSQPLPAGATFLKETNGTYSPYPASLTPTAVTFALIDNGGGDGNPALGAIDDPSGIGFDLPATAAAIPTLSTWGLILLAGLLGFFEMGRRRRLD